MTWASTGSQGDDAQEPRTGGGHSPGAAMELKVPFYYLSVFDYGRWFYHRVAKFIPRAAYFRFVFLRCASGSV